MRLPRQHVPHQRDSTMDLEVAKAKLKEKTAEVQTLKHDFEGIFSALCHTSSELEKVNIQIEHHKRLIAGLAKEKAMLRQLEGHGIEDVNGVDAPMASDEDASSSSCEPGMTFDHGSADEPMACDQISSHLKYTCRLVNKAFLFCTKDSDKRTCGSS